MYKASRLAILAEWLFYIGAFIFLGVFAFITVLFTLSGFSQEDLRIMENVYSVCHDNGNYSGYEEFCLDKQYLLDYLEELKKTGKVKFNKEGKLEWN